MSSAGRVTCPQCGSNNFGTVTMCWKCNAPLRGAPPVAAPPANAPSPSAGRSAAPSAAPFSASSAHRAASGACEATSNRSAVWLGLLFPYVGLPVGLVFMMLDDDRRQQVGRACVLWSCVSLALHLLIMLVAGLGMREMLFAVLQGARGAASRPGGYGGVGGY